MTKIEIENFIGLALVQAKKALRIGEVPIGSVIVNKHKEVVGAGYNKTEKLSDPTAHAEIIAIRAAAKKLGDWRLDGHVIFTTIQPCEMCMGAIIEARMEEIYYGSTNTKKKNEAKLVKSQLIKHAECTNLLKEFFQDLR